MKIRILIACCLLFAGCAATPSANSFVGTWQLREHGYYLRIYADGRAVTWPVPPDGETSWTTFKDGVIHYHYEPPLKNPELSLREDLLVMKTNVGEQLFTRIPRDLEPPQ